MQFRPWTIGPYMQSAAVFPCSVILVHARTVPSWRLGISTCRQSRSAAYTSATMARSHLPPGLDNVQDIEEHRPGGYHPVHLGDVLDGRYKIVHNAVSKSYYALEILKAEETTSSKELQTLQLLAVLQSDHPGQSHLHHGRPIQCQWSKRRA